MLLRWIEKTRKKPKAVRNQYAFVGAIAVTALIVVVWAVSLPTKIAKIAAEHEGTDIETVGAFSRFFNDAKQNFATAVKGETQEEGLTEPTEATTTKKTERIVVPQLTPDTIEDVQDEYQDSTLPAPRAVLIETVAKKDHINATTTAQ